MKKGRYEINGEQILILPDGTRGYVWHDNTSTIEEMVPAINEVVGYDWKRADSLSRSGDRVFSMGGEQYLRGLRGHPMASVAIKNPITPIGATRRDAQDDRNWWLDLCEFSGGVHRYLDKKRGAHVFYAGARKTLWRVNACEALLQWSRDIALSVIHLWPRTSGDDLRIVRAFLETGDAHLAEWAREIVYVRYRRVSGWTLSTGKHALLSAYHATNAALACPRGHLVYSVGDAWDHATRTCNEGMGELLMVDYEQLLLHYVDVLRKREGERI